jgi:hypothetical protein
MIDTKVEVHLHIIYDVLGGIGEEQSIAVAKGWKSRASRLQEPAQIQLLIYVLYLATDFLSINNTFGILRLELTVIPPSAMLLNYQKN